MNPNSTNSAPKRLRVAAAQMIFADSIPGNLEKIEDAATKAAKVGADAVLFPECATTGYTCDFGALKPAALRQALRLVAAVAARLQVNLLVGSPIFSGRRLYNALVGEWGAYYEDGRAADAARFVIRQFDSLGCGDTYWDYSRALDASPLLPALRRRAHRQPSSKIAFPSATPPTVGLPSR